MVRFPFSYNLRSMFVRKSTTLLTVFSTAATVAVLAGMLSLQQGFATMFTERGREDLAVFLRFGAGSEGESAIPRDRADVLVKGTAEIVLDGQGQPLASAEVFSAIRRFKLDGGETNVPIRGVQPQTFAIHGDDIRIVEGRNFRPGADEIVVGVGLTHRIQGCQLGAEMRINTVPFRVVGVFTSKGGYQSEVWGDAERMLTALQRSQFSRILAVVDPARMAELTERMAKDPQAPTKVLSEREYLGNQTGFISGLFIGLGVFLAVIMGLGAVFTGTNAMLSAITARTHEIGVLQAIGFRPVPIFFAFLTESVLVGLLGGVVGCLAVIPLNGIRTGTSNFQTFSEVTFAFQITPPVLITAVVFAIVLGLVGGAIPAWKAATMQPTEALRRG